MSKEPEEIVRRWRRIIIAVAFLLPMLSIVKLVWSASHAPHGGGAEAADAFGILVVFYPVMVLVFDWPFLVLAVAVKHQVLKHWPDARAATAAIAVGLTGQSIPYLVLYSLLLVNPPPSVTFPPLSATRLISPGTRLLLLIVFLWIIGGVLAYLGLRIGPLVVRRGKHGDR